MNLSAGDLLQSTEALLGFSIFFIPPGYLLASLLQIANFRALSLPERLLWSISISTPVAILMSVLLRKHLSSGLSNDVVYICGIGFAILLALQAYKNNSFRASEWDRPTRLITLVMAGLAVYVLLATVGIQVGNRLFESVAAGDWSVRVPLVNAGIRDGVPPHNPFYLIDGQSYHLRYYYYWYVLCGQLGRMLHASARAVLAASAAWAGIALFSVLFLYFKYLFQPNSEDKAGTSIRTLCLLSVPVSGILGLDIIPTAIGALTHRSRVFPDMDWWREMGDFAPSFHTNIIYGPHHAAGLACNMTGFLALTLCVTRPDGIRLSLGRQLALGALAGVCFAAAAGTSTYITLFFVLTCILFTLDRLMSRDWNTIAALATSGLTAFLLSWSFIHETLTANGATTHDRHGGHFLALFPRNWSLTYHVLHLRINGFAIPIFPHGLDALLRVPVWIALFVVEIGFFGFVLAYRTFHDWRKRSTLETNRRLQWILFLSIAFCGLCVSSADLIGVNDLGTHAGFALRFIAVLWATPLIARWLWGKDPWPLLERPWLRRVILATAILGLSAQIWQAVLQRTYFMLVDSNYLAVREPFPRFGQIGKRYFQTREALDSLDHILPNDAAIQYNPRTPYLAMMTIYLNRPVAAGDSRCMAAFGGNASACKDAMPQLQALFGGSSYKSRIPFDAQGITHNAFVTVCARHHLAAVVATSSDRVWPEKQSWVWNETLLYGGPTIRILACPKEST